MEMRWNLAAAKQKQPRPKLSYYRSFERQAYLLLLLPLIGLFVFTLYPLLWSARLAFYNYEGSMQSAVFVGFDNFLRAFSDSYYWKTWLTTLEFALIKLPIELPIALLLAMLLNKKIKGVGAFRSIYFLPHIISVAIIGVVFTSLFDYYGFVNTWLMKFGIISEGVEWYATKGRAMFVLVLGSIWNSFGINVLYFTAALNNIPEELYEAAKIDGANRWASFRRITLPMMAPVAQTILLLSINGTLQTNEYILVMTNGGPGGDTYTVMSYLVGQFIPGFATAGANIGYGCCLSIVTAAIMGGIAVAYTRLSNKLSNIY